MAVAICITASNSVAATATDFTIVPRPYWMYGTRDVAAHGTPWLFDRLLDVPRLLRWVSRFAVKTKAEDLGGLTVSMLQGTHGKQKKEVLKLVEWLSSDGLLWMQCRNHR